MFLSCCSMLSKLVGELYVGSLNSPFGEIKVTKTLKALDKKIIECSWDYKSNQWVFMRERTDKSFPNAYATAEGPFIGDLNQGSERNEFFKSF